MVYEYKRLIRKDIKAEVNPTPTPAEQHGKHLSNCD